MFTKETRESRWSSQATGFAENFACVRFTGIEWQYLEGATWTQFVPLPTDVLLARIEFDNSSITDLKGEDEEFFTVKKGYVDGDLEFSSSSLASGIVEIVGTSFVARCGEDLWCRNGSRPEDVTGTLYCCDASCETCGGEDCGSDEANNICCLDTLLNAGRICRDHDDVSCLIPEAILRANQSTFTVYVFFQGILVIYIYIFFSMWLELPTHFLTWRHARVLAAAGRTAYSTIQIAGTRIPG